MESQADSQTYRSGDRGQIHVAHGSRRIIFRDDTKVETVEVIKGEAFPETRKAIQIEMLLKTAYN